MQEIEERSGGVWRPSPGSIYRRSRSSRTRDSSAATRAPAARFQLTDEGRAYLEENREALGSPWDEAGGDLPEGISSCAS